MPHSYTATPADDPIVQPTPPLDWPPGWGYPGPPYPPGYSPDSPTGFNSDDDKEPLPPWYRVRATMAIDYVDPDGTLDTELEMSKRTGSYSSPFSYQVPFDEVEWNYAAVQNSAEGELFYTEVLGAGFDAGGTPGVDSWVEFDGLVKGTSHLVYLYLLDQFRTYTITLTLDIFRTPWVPLPSGGYELGVEAKIGQMVTTHVSPYSTGHGVFFPGWLNIQRNNVGIEVSEQWGYFAAPVGIEQYLI